MAYVYRQIRKDTNQPFYIGIGKSDNGGKFIRSKSTKNRNKYWYNIVNKTEYEVEILFNDLTWEEAVKKEVEFITLYGRRDLNLGTLVNMTNGGDGMSGYVMPEDVKRKIGESNRGRIVSEETRSKIRESNTGFRQSEEVKAKMRKPKSEEHKINLSKSHKGQVAWNKGKSLSAEHVQNIRLSKKNKPWSDARRAAQKNKKINN